MATTTHATRFAFGLYEADLRSGELWKAGHRVKLQSQPFKVLAALLERPGEVVTRDELQNRLWGKNIVVDFDHSLGTAINKIREALGDSAENPRFVETLSRRGYRFIAPVSPVDPESGAPEAPLSAVRPSLVRSPLSDPASSHGYGQPARPFPQTEPRGKLAEAARSEEPGSENPAGAVPAGSSSQSVSGLAVGIPTRRGVWLVAVAGVAVAAVLGYRIGGTHPAVAPTHIVQVTHNDHLAPSISTMEDLRADATDGIHLFASTISNGHSGLSSIALNFGSVEPLNISEDVMSPSLGDISPDNAHLLVHSHLSPESEQPLWVVPTLGGSAQRVGDVVAHDATWMPTGDTVLYAAGNSLYTTRLGGSPELFAQLPGRAFWLRWQPNGHLLRFTLMDPLAHTTSLWQLSFSDRHPTRMLTNTGNEANGCCGVWADSGKSFVFQATENGSTDLWRLNGVQTDRPVRLTDGPLQYGSPVAARTGPRVYFLGVDARSQLARLDPDGNLVPEKGFLEGAVRVDVSRDRSWVAWTDDHGALWRAHTNGSDKLQLTTGLDVFLTHWSPDGTQLAVMAREPGKAWQIYAVPARGGEPHRLLQEDRNAADPSWSPDGQQIVFGRVNDFMGKEQAPRDLEVLDLRSTQITVVPESQGLFSPRWSPDGRYIAALTLDQRRVKLFDVAEKRWLTPDVNSGADPVWTADSRSLIVHASLDLRQPLVQIQLPDLKVKELVQLAGAEKRDPVDFVFVGLDPEGRPLVRSRTYAGNVYYLDLR